MINSKEIKISVCCLAYNHEKYIRQALDSIIMQKTSFNYEILIHDDASTDNTIAILKEYENKYPKQIKCIYEKENQYRKGKINEVLHKLFCISNGQYIALNECDDYWIDKNKLQKQVDFLEKNDEYSLCVHAAIHINPSGEKIKNGMIRPMICDGTIELKNILLNDGGLIPTNSMVFRKRMVNSLPEYYFSAPVGDYPLTITLALRGKVFYIDANMSAYRVNTPGSWSDNMRTGDYISKSIDMNNKLNAMLKEVDIHSEYEFSDFINKRIRINDFHTEMLRGSIKSLKVNFADLYKDLRLRTKLRLKIEKKFPVFVRIIKRIRNG